jgi:putative ABC transport system substrate-binding protein
VRRLGPGLLWLALLVSAAVAVQSTVARAQGRPAARIGVLTEGWGPTPATIGLRDGLQSLGHREGEQFELGVRFTRGDVGALPEAARQLVAAGSHIIIALSANAALAAQQATTRIPIVFAEVIGDPVKLGLVQSFARPGGNITGISTLHVELNPKRLELFKELVPGLKRVLIVYDPTDADATAAIRVYREAAAHLGLQILERTPRSREEAREAIARARRPEVDGIVVATGMALNIPGALLEAAAQHLPTMFNAPFWVERGAFAGYGPDFYDSGRQASRLVLKILRGEKAADIPVETTNARIEFAINLKTARALKIPIGQSLLQRADRVIE